MKKKIELGTVIFLVVAVAILSAFATYMYLVSLMPSLAATEEQYNRVIELVKTVDKHYVGEIEEDVAMSALLSGYTQGVDKYGTYFDEENYTRYKSEMDGKHSGIGLTVKYIASNGLLKVVDVKSNSPAANSNIKVGDLVYKINETLVSEISYEEAVSMLKAENGTEMTVTVLRNEKEIEKKMTVAEYLTSSVEYKLIYDNIGYLSISEFDNTTYDDFKSAIDSLVKDGAQKFIFDVRNNTGGSLSSVVNVLDYLLPEGDLVTLEDKTGTKKTHSSDKNFFDKEFVVLINGSTYSGGELFAAAVRDFKAGKLIGQTTYGKGYAQEIIPLEKGALYLSTKLYFPPSGVNYEGVGVSPDVEVLLTPELEDRFFELTPEEDLQVAAALKELGKKIDVSSDVTE